MSEEAGKYNSRSYWNS